MPVYLNLNIVLHCKDSIKIKFVYKIGTYVCSIGTIIALRNKNHT